MLHLPVLRLNLVKLALDLGELCRRVRQPAGRRLCVGAEGGAVRVWGRGG